MIALKKGEVCFGCLVLRCQDNTVYGFAFSGRSMDEIRTDGTFRVSSGAANVGICTVAFDKDSYRVDKFTYCETNNNSDVLFFVDHEEASEDEWEETVGNGRKRLVLNGLSIQIAM